MKNFKGKGKKMDLKEFFKSRIIGLTGGLVILISSFLPWVTSGEKVLYGFWFGLLFIITLIFGVISIAMFLLGKKIAYKTSIGIGIIGIIWTLYLFSEMKSFGAKFVWIVYDAEWLGEAATIFVKVNYGLYIMLIGFILTLLGGVNSLVGNTLKIGLVGLIVSLIIGYLALRASGTIKQSGFESFRCFSCEKMPKELASANLFLEWYSKISNNNISSKDMKCLKICKSYYENNTPSGYHEVTLNYKGKNFTLIGVGYIESEEKVAQSKWWFELKNFCFTAQECTGIEVIYKANSPWREKGPTKGCINKYLATYRLEDAKDYVNSLYGALRIENWTVTGYNCSCRKHILYEENVCGGAGI